MLGIWRYRLVLFMPMMSGMIAGALWNNSMSLMPLPRSFYERSPVVVAQELLGKMLVRIVQGNVLTAIITETEAYCGLVDPASHAYRGKTARNAAMFGVVGHSYIYFIYGNHYCLNLVAHTADEAAGGVLIRGLKPIAGIEIMQQLRQKDAIDKLTNGPGNIGQALHLSLQHNHIDVTMHGELYVVDGIVLNSSAIRATPRIGISKAQDKLWRFIVHTI
ncbi:DNA-3-methyladenine glycosylase [Candidatus Dependentiae bacterium]|nr:DNA-3-methyladenine glycosylase [Candidatus Dependentiae bacterium]